MTAIETATSLGRTRKVATALALVAGGALTLSACGAGQISQTASQVAAVNGTSTDAGDIALRNVHVLYPDNGEYALEDGGTVELGFTAINNSGNTADRLVEITTDEADEVVIEPAQSGGDELPPLSGISAGVRDDNAALDDPLVPISAVSVELVGISDNVRNGLTIPITFTFENAGDIVIDAPIDAGPMLERSEDSILQEHEGEE